MTSSTSPVYRYPFKMGSVKLSWRCLKAYIPCSVILIIIELHQIYPINSTIDRVINKNIFILIKWGVCASRFEIELYVLCFSQIQIYADKLTTAMLKQCTVYSRTPPCGHPTFVDTLPMWTLFARPVWFSYIILLTQDFKFH